METAEKLDRIIELLKKIYVALPGTPAQPKPIAAEKNTIPKNLKPTPTQLRDKRMVEMVAHADRNSFMTAWKKGIYDLIQLRKLNPNFYPMFQTQALEWFDNPKNKWTHPFKYNLKMKP